MIFNMDEKVAKYVAGEVKKAIIKERKDFIKFLKKYRNMAVVSRNNLFFMELDEQIKGMEKFLEKNKYMEKFLEKNNKMHKTKPLKVWIDIDLGIYESVKLLNTIEGIRTFSSCQGTIGEGGSHPHKPYIMIYCPKSKLKVVKKSFDISKKMNGWIYVHPKKK